jgi:hypothetical protein
LGQSSGRSSPQSHLDDDTPTDEAIDGGSEENFFQNFDPSKMEWDTNEDGQWIGTIPNFHLPKDPEQIRILREQIAQHIQDKYGVPHDKIEIMNMRNES